MSASRIRVRSLALTVALATMSALVLQASPRPAQAADVGVAELKQMVTDVGTWTSGLAEVGKLAEKVPLVGSSAGSILGFPDLVQKAVRDQINSLDNWSDYSGDKTVDLGGTDGRTGTLTLSHSESSGTHTVAFHLSLSKTLTSEPFSFVNESPKVNLSAAGGVSVTASISLDFAIAVAPNGGGHSVYVINDATVKPGFTVDVTTSLPTAAPGLSAAIGILGVTATAAVGHNTASIHLAATVDDPDGDGKLYVTMPDGTDGELKDPTAAVGLVHVGFAASGAGAIDAQLTITAQTNASFSLPAINATVTVLWPNISTGSPAVNVTGLDPADAFQRLSPRDLADMLAQLVSMLNGSQRSPGNVALPFLSGTLADALKGAEGLVDFLKKNVTQPPVTPDDPVDPARVGEPAFRSIQELAQKLADYTGTASLAGTDFTVAIGALADDRLPIDLTISRNAPTAVNVVDATVAVAGVATYTSTTLVDNSKEFGDDLLGRRVIAASFGGTIETISADKHTITLAQAWIGGTPPNGSAYAINGPEVNAGAVNLANLLGNGTQGIRNANAITPTATVKPEYTVQLKFALDLSAPRTGAACLGATGADPGGTISCPYTRTNADGSHVIITEEPLPVERLLIKTGYDLVSANFPIDTGISVFAKAGFLSVKLGGSIKICRTGDSATCAPAAGTVDPMLSITLNTLTGESEYVPVGTIFSSLVSAPTDRLSFATNIRAAADGEVSVPEAAGFFPGGDPSAGFTASWPDITVGAPTVDVSGLSAILNFDIDPTDPQALLGIVLRVLTLFGEQLQADNGGTGVMGTKIPLVDKSLSDLLGADEAGGGPDVTYGTGTFDPPGDTPDVPTTTLTDASRTGDRAFPSSLAGRSVIVGTKVAVVLEVQASGSRLAMTALETQPADGTPYLLRSGLDDAISLLTASPPDSLQELVKLLDDRLGGNGVDFTYEVIDSAPHLVVTVGWERGYSISTPIKFDVGGETLAGTQASGAAEVKVAADLDVGLAVPLAIPAGGVGDIALKVKDDSHVSIEAEASVNGDIQANVGPLTIALGDPSSATSNATAKARYSVGLAGADDGDGDGVTELGDFFDNATPTINGYTGEVDCGEAADAGTDELALCANLPMFVSTNGTTFNPLVFASGADGIEVRLPKAGPVSNLFDFTGTVSATDTRPRLEAPDAADFAAAFAAALLDFGMIGEGIDAFLLMVENALKKASMEGKLPVVGDDLQAGADFIGDLRTELDALFVQVEAVNGGKLPTAEKVNEFLNEGFNDALDAAGANPENFSLAITCLLQPSNVTSAALDAGGTGTGTSWSYKVVAVGGLNGGDVDTKPGTAMTADGPATLDGTDKINIEWSVVSNATKYKVLRSKDGGAFELVHTTADETDVTFADEGAAGAAYTEQTALASVDECAGVPIIDIQGVVLRVDIGTGTVSGAEGCVDVAGPPAKPCLTSEIPLNIGIPGLSLKAAEQGGIQAKVGYKIHLALELNREHGLSILTKDQGAPEIGIGLNLDAVNDATSGVALEATLAFLRITLAKAEGATVPAFAAAFQVDLASGTPATEPSCFLGTEGTPACDADGNKRLGFAEIASAEAYTDLVRPRLDLHLNVDWLLKATVDASLPGVQARLVMSWNKVISTQSLSDDTLNNDFTVAFEDVYIDAGAFLTEVLGPIVSQIKKITGPVQPIIDLLYAPIPVISDLSEAAGGPPVTLVTLAKAFSTIAGGPKLDFVDTIAGVISFVNNLPAPNTTGDALLIPVGNFSVDSSTAFKTPATPDAGPKAIKTRTFKNASGDPVAESAVDLAGTIDSKSDKPSLKQGGANSAASKGGFAFPLLDNPGSIFNLIMGGDVDLVTFDSGPLTLGFTWRQSFGPVYAPPPVFITLSGSASVTAQIQAGFDTYGLRKAFEIGFTPGGVAQILNGLYFKSTNDDGSPLPVVTFYGEIAAGAAVSAVIITVGIEGGVSLTISLAWNDPNNDGKFRLFEFGMVALTNPICLFQMSGRIGLFLRVYITLGFSPFSVSFSFTLADITLLDFNVKPDCEPPPPRLGGVSGTTLIVFAGKLGTGTIRGHAAWDNDGDGYGDDVVKVTQTHDFDETTGAATKTGVKIDMLGISETWSDPAITKVVVDGRGYDHKMKVTFIGDGDKSKTGPTGSVPTGGFTMDAVVIGGSEADVVKTGSGRSQVDGAGGNDTITTGDVPASGRVGWIAGGAGDDSITTGNADVIAAGDSSLSTSGDKGPLTLTLADELPGTKSVSGIVDWDDLAAPGFGENLLTNGSDRLTVGRGNNSAYGNGGNDAIGVAADSPVPGGPPAGTNTVVLGTGSDTVKGGSNNDTIWTGLHTSQARTPFADRDVDGPGGTDIGSRNTVDTGGGSDTVFGGTIDDFVTTGSSSSQKAVVTGGSGRDVLLGRYGTDELFGGPGKDWVVAEPALVGDNLPVNAVDALGTLVRTYTHTPLPTGTLSNTKVLVGGDNEDRIIGGDGAATIFGDRYETDACGSPAATPESTQPDEPVNAGDGRDLITGGAGVDTVKAGGAADKVTTFAGDDLVCGQAGDDELFAGDHADKVWGGSGADRAYGENGADRVYGNNDNDQLYGGAQNDVIEGNNGSDKAYGGTENDLVLGGSRAAALADQGDILYGDVGDDILIGDNGSDTYPLDLDGATATAGGADTLFAGPDADNAYGGLASDIVWGGSGADHLEGNNAADTVYGEAGEDEIIGGSSEQVGITGVGRPDGGDALSGGEHNDLIVGDNAMVAKVMVGSTALIGGRGFSLGHSLGMLDLGDTPANGNSGMDTIQGDAGNDVVVAGGKSDSVYGDENDDYLEGNAGIDTIYGGEGSDDIVGGSSPSTGGSQPDDGDIITGDEDNDVVLGDNGSLLRTGATHPVTQGRGIVERAISLLDTVSGPAGHFGADTVHGNAGTDILFGQRAGDLLYGDGGDDYAEGDQETDLIEGGSGQDDLVGGGSVTLSQTGTDTDTAVGQSDTDDVVYGGSGADVVTGDNAEVLRVEIPTVAAYSPITDRAGMVPRTLRPLDLAKSGGVFTTTPAGVSGGDQLSGGSGDDVVLGQDGNDWVTGGDDGDYVEGNGGNDNVFGDRLLHGDRAGRVATGVPGIPAALVSGLSSLDEQEGAATADGQDDLIGGSSNIAPTSTTMTGRNGFRDGPDNVFGDGEADYELGDNGTLLREQDAGTYKRMVERYPIPYTVPAGGDPRAMVRHAIRLDIPATTSGVSAGDVMQGNDGEDFMWGQTGDDLMNGDNGNDDMYGELGVDTMFGDAGDDAMLGDRGGMVSRWLDGSPGDPSMPPITMNSPPKETLVGLAVGTLDRRVDQLHDNAANASNSGSIAAFATATLAADGISTGGADRMRGGLGKDSMHGEAGNDLMNGDSGGDVLFGDDGSDAMWGGRGCDPVVDATTSDCLTNGVFDQSSRGTGDRFVDRMMSGRGGLPIRGTGVPELMDHRPRGVYSTTPSATTCSGTELPITDGARKNPVTVDPCSWFLMTSTDTASASGSQHYQGTDWMYGGWDRDVMEGDVAANGPNPGDRMIDWPGVVNLWNHCNAAYGGFNDVRQLSPEIQDFLQRWAYSTGAGQTLTGPNGVLTAGTSGFNELALVYTGDIKDNAGSPYPTTPGHFEEFSCAP